MGKLILAGGGDANQSKQTDIDFLQLIDKRKPLLYIPLAMPLSRYTYEQDLEWISSTFSQFNFTNIQLGIDLANIKDIDENYSAVYIGGGNTYLLADFLQKSSFYDELEDYIKLDNGIIYGGSAGAIILGNDIRSSNDENKIGISNFDGLNLLQGYSILPHWSETNESRISQLYNIGINRIICIPEDSSLIYDTDLREGKVIGKIRIYDENNVQEFSNGGSIQL